MNTEQIIINAKKCFDIQISTLQRTANSLNKNFIDAVKLIQNSHKVIVSGVGKSGIIGQKIAATLSSTGITAVFLHPVEALHGDIGMVQKDDVAILISKSGNTEELVRLIPYLKMRNAKMIAIVGNTNSHLASNSDVVLDAAVEKEACPFNLAPTSSTTTTLVLGDALAICLMHERNFSLKDFSKLHPLGQIGRTITLKVADVMKKLNEIPILKPNATLKDAVIEMTHLPVGCLCIANEKGMLLGIITDGDIRRVIQGVDDINMIFNSKVSQNMTSHPVVVEKNTQLVEALALMENRTQQISVLPVVETIC
jgi:arabinose-5-phosphate isomerase